MREETFWGIVESCREEAGADTVLVARLILRRLRTLTPSEIGEYERLWFRAQGELYCWPVRDAATLLLGPFDDDTFLAVQDWIVSHGRRVMRRVKADPDSLVELAADRHNARIDWFCGLPVEAHIGLTGRPSVGEEPSGPAEPAGVPAPLTDVGEASRRFPRLTAYLDQNSWMARPWNAD